MTSLSLICEYGSSSEDEHDEDDDIVEVMEVVEEEKHEYTPQTQKSTFFDADIISVVETLISKVERRHQHHYQNNYHHHQNHYPFSTSKYRTPNNDETSEEDSTTSSDSDSDITIWSAFSEDDENDEDFENFSGNKTNGKNSQPRSKPKHCVTKGELTVDDLPPIERLQISVEVRCLTQVGLVSSMVNQLVVVQSFKSVPVLDLDTVLFCREGTSIGQIFDVIGPVKQPNYVLRFNSPEEAAVDCKLSINSPIYYAEENQNQAASLTKYVFVQQLEREKGCDASWKHNNEPPPEEVDYSDDEVERGERWRKKKGQKRSRGGEGFNSGAVQQANF